MEQSNLQNLVELALSIGATNAKAINSSEIFTEQRLANYCSESPCVNYGLSPGCPPHVGGPSEIQELQKTHHFSIVVRNVVSRELLFSEERRGIMQALHKIVAAVQYAAVGMGHSYTKAFAAGSCKDIFCHEHSECSVLAGNGLCRNPKHARASMSGYGINVSKLMNTCGLPDKIDVRGPETDADAMAWVAGLVMVG